MTGDIPDILDVVLLPADLPLMMQLRTSMVVGHSGSGTRAGYRRGDGSYTYPWRRPRRFLPSEPA